MPQAQTDASAQTYAPRAAEVGESYVGMSKYHRDGYHGTGIFTLGIIGVAMPGASSGLAPSSEARSP